jgi:hypothetical protein
MNKLKSCAVAAFSSALLAGAVIAGCTSPARADDVPPYMSEIAGKTSSTPGATADKNILALNNAMFDLYEDAGRIFRQNLLDHHPVILALFSGAGGHLILYRPGQPPLDAPSVPIQYQLLKSIGHSTMAIAEVASSHLDNPDDLSWMAQMQAYRSRMQSALDGLPSSGIQADWQQTNHDVLTNNIAFMDDCVAKKLVSAAALEAFAHKQAPLLKLDVSWAATIQVHHWMGVMADWKKMLGSDWDKTYGASNTIYVARQNNVLFSVLAQFFGPDAINSRLMLIETVSFTTTPDDMLTSVTRIISDRSVGALVFGDYHLMDYELMGGDGRKAIIAETAKMGMKPFLPPVVPFGSHQWPTLITPGPGAASLDDLH